MSRGAYRPKAYYNVLHGGTTRDAPEGHGNRFERRLNNALMIDKLRRRGLKISQEFKLPNEKLYRPLNEVTNDELDKKKDLELFVFSKKDSNDTKKT